MNTRKLPPCPHCMAFYPLSVSAMSIHLRFECPVLRPGEDPFARDVLDDVDTLLATQEVRRRLPVPIIL